MEEEAEADPSPWLKQRRPDPSKGEISYEEYTAKTRKRKGRPSMEGEDEEKDRPGWPKPVVRVNKKRRTEKKTRRMLERADRYA